jgi:hypothetical protein
MKDALVSARTQKDKANKEDDCSLIEGDHKGIVGIGGGEAPFS